MAKSGRKSRADIHGLLRNLANLNAQRVEVAKQVVVELQAMMSENPFPWAGEAPFPWAGEAPFPWASATGAVGTSKRARRGGGRRKGFKMSAEARAKIAAAQRARWAKQKAKKG